MKKSTFQLQINTTGIFPKQNITIKLYLKTFLSSSSSSLFVRVSRGLSDTRTIPNRFVKLVDSLIKYLLNITFGTNFLKYLGEKL